MKAGDRRLKFGLFEGIVKKAVDNEGFLATHKKDEVEYEEFKEREDLTEAIIKHGVKTVDDGAFKDCENLYKVVYPASIEKIGKFAHLRNGSLKHVFFQGLEFYPECTNGLKELGTECFAGCESLRMITLPLSVEKVGKNIFEGCYNLEMIECLDKVADVLVEQIEYDDWHSRKMCILGRDKHGRPTEIYEVGKFLVTRRNLIDISEGKTFVKSLVYPERGWVESSNEQTKKSSNASGRKKDLVK